MRADTPLFQLSTDRYPVLKSQFPSEGRRTLYLRVAEEFWNRLNSNQLQVTSAVTHSTEPNQVKDSDPYDLITHGPELGILVRADYSNEDAWQAFYARLQESEKEFAEDSQSIEVNTDISTDSNSEPLVARTTEDVEMDEDSDSDSDSDNECSSIFKVINPTSPRDREAFSNISNITALRLLNDVDIRPAPEPPVGTKRINPPNRLIDHGGWQEIYEGKSIWIYDGKSNSDDQSVRAVSQHGDIYGTATADSWRARVSHICDLQINICNGMKIDFGGLDGWDYNERRRNMDEVNRLMA